VPTPADIYAPRPGKPEYLQSFSMWEKGPAGEPVLKRGERGKQVGDDAETAKGRTLSSWVRQYNQAVLALDEGIGKVLAELEASGQLKNTLVIFTSDQGFAWGQHGFRQKLAPYDANIRSPLVLSMPGTIPEGKVVKHPVGGVDIAPTIYSFAKLPLPWEMHGHDLTPLLKNPSAAWPHPTLMPYTGHHFGADTDAIPKGNDVYHSGVPWYLMLTEGRFKYVRTLIANETEELYDLQADPDELTNLALGMKNSATLEKFRAATVAELKRTHAGMANQLPPVRTAAK
jgi:arylsulfatase A-like enzyme